MQQVGTNGVIIVGSQIKPMNRVVSPEANRSGWAEGRIAWAIGDRSPQRAAHSLLRSQNMIRFDGLVLVLDGFRRSIQVIIEIAGPIGCGYERQNIPGDRTESICRNHVPGKRRARPIRSCCSGVEYGYQITAAVAVARKVAPFEF